MLKAELEQALQKTAQDLLAAKEEKRELTSKITKLEKEKADLKHALENSKGSDRELAKYKERYESQVSSTEGIKKELTAMKQAKAELERDKQALLKEKEAFQKSEKTNKESYEKLIEAYKHKVAEVGRINETYTALLKVLQGTLDAHIELNTLYNKKQ